MKSVCPTKSACRLTGSTYILRSGVIVVVAPFAIPTSNLSWKSAVFALAIGSPGALVAYNDLDGPERPSTQLILICGYTCRPTIPSCHAVGLIGMKAG